MVILTDNMRGALMMMAAMTCFTVNDAFLKLLGDDLPLFQVLFLRGIATIVLLAGIAHLRGQLWVALPPGGWRLVLIRTGAEALAAYFFVTALFNMELANVSAILQALPLTVSLAGAVFLGEAVGWRRLVAILVGFAGVMLIVQPGGDGFTIYSLYALGAVACVTVRDLAARKMPPAVPTLFVSLIAAIGVTAFAGVGAAFGDWRPVPSHGWALLGLATAFIIGGYIFSVAAMRVGEIGFVAPFRYASLIVALVLGAAIFGTFPEPLTLAGAVIVVATGVFTIWRERQARRRQPAG